MLRLQKHTGLLLKVCSSSLLLNFLEAAKRIMCMNNDQVKHYNNLPNIVSVPFLAAKTALTHHNIDSIDS